MSLKRKESKQDVTVVGQVGSASESMQSPVEMSIPISFDDWWIQTQNKLNLKPELKNAMKKHFIARGFMDYKKFNAGLRDFGFRA